MKNLIQELIYDKEIVGKIKETNLNKDILYNHLSNGRIMLQEYLSAAKIVK